ncbi:O-antigen ligase family protein [Deinococcus marmoris]|uniref:O-antigen ligase family protein n=1 Tax=Deinococcus marmoris TaxID=249408 RepID=UPI000495F281|nr:O-antigen ligase family protein [Deinococcus marmoris]
MTRPHIGHGWSRLGMAALGATAAWAPLAQGSAFDGGRAGLVILAAVTFFATTLAARRGAVTWGRVNLWLAAAITLAAWTVLSAAQAPEHFGARQQGALMVATILSAVSARALLADARRRRVFAQGLVVVVAIMAAYVALQHFTGGFTLRSDPGALTGLYYHPSHYAGFVTLAVPVAVWGVGFAARPFKVLGAVSALILVASLPFTNSSSMPTALLAGALAACAALWHWRRVTGALALAAVMLALAGSVWLLGSDPGRATLDAVMRGTQTKSVDRFILERQALWTMDQQAAEHAGVFGVGPGGFVNTVPRYRPAVADGTNDHAFGFVNYAHNDYYQMAIELGAVGLGLYVLAMLGAALPLRRLDPLGWCLLSGLVPLWTAGIWDGNATAVPGTALWMWVCVGVVAASQPATAPRPRPLPVLMPTPLRFTDQTPDRRTPLHATDD